MYTHILNEHCYDIKILKIVEFNLELLKFSFLRRYVNIFLINFFLYAYKVQILTIITI